MEANKYIECPTLTNSVIDIWLKEKEYPIAKYFILCLIYDDSGYNILYDFESGNGKVLFITSKTDRKVYMTDLSGYIQNGHYCIGADGYELGFEMPIEYADPFAEDEQDVKFFKVINKGTDEEVYSQLISSLMNCAMNMKA